MFTHYFCVQSLFYADASLNSCFTAFNLCHNPLNILKFIASVPEYSGILHYLEHNITICHSNGYRNIHSALHVIKGHHYIFLFERNLYLLWCFSFNLSGYGLDVITAKFLIGFDKLLKISLGPIGKSLPFIKTFGQSFRKRSSLVV